MTSFGINNEGQLVFDYMMEDVDQLEGANVYNGQNSTLWVNFREAFADEIKETYQNLRNDGYITYDKLVDQFITKGSDKWSESIYNADGEFKYISMLKSDNDATNLPQVRGSGEEHFRYFVENRLNYCDSKWYASDYANDYVSLRIYTPTTWSGVEPNASITVTPYSNMYAGVRYKANGTLYQKRVEHGIPVTFEAPEETFNDTETAIYGASQISSLGDLAPLYCGSINVANANKLIELKIGDNTTGYSNPNLKELSVGTNKLLKTIDIRNCPDLAISLGLTGCPNIEEVYATGSGITGVELTNGGCLRIAKLPSTISNLTLKNQFYIEDLTLEGYDSLKTLWIENSPTLDTLDILEKAVNVERVRLTNVNWNYPDASVLYELIERDLAGIDENGTNTSTMWVDGNCHIGTLTGAEFGEIKSLFPYLTITYDNLTTQLVYMSEDGTTELHRETIINGGNGTDPVVNGTFDTPVKESTAQYDFAYSGWSLTSGGDADANALLNVESDRTVYVAFSKTIRSYTVNFYTGSTLLYSTVVEYGSDATYIGDTPTNDSTGDTTDFEFTGWKPEPTSITGNLDCYAQFYDTREITDDWATIEANVLNGTATSLYAIGSYKPVEITYEDGTSETIDMEVIAHNHDELGDGIYKWERVSTVPVVSTNAVVIEYNSKLHYLFALKHYTWDGSTWTSDVSTPPYNLNGAIGIVYNSELHVFGSCGDTNYKTAHYKYDGSTWIEVSTLPFDMTGSGSVVIYNNEIHILGNNSTNHYKWDGTEWTSVSTLPGGFMSANASCVYNGEIYIMGSTYGILTGNIYKYNGSEWTHVLDISAIIPNSDARPYIINGEMYIISRNNNSRGLYKFNETSIEKIASCHYNITQACVYGGEIHSVSGTYAQNDHWKWSTKNWVKTNIENIWGWQKANNTTIDGVVYVRFSNAIYKFDNNEMSFTKVIDCPSATRYRAFTSYNGELYLLSQITNAETSEVYGSLLKLYNDEWIEVVTMNLDNSTFDAAMVEYKGKLHILYGGGHRAYDGTELTIVSSDLEYTYRVYRGQSIVYNDCIYFATGYYNDAICKYDGETYSYVCAPKITGAEKLRFCVYNDKLHIVSQKETKTFDDATNTFENSFGGLTTAVGEGFAFVSGGKFYVGGGTSAGATAYVLQSPPATLTFMAKNLLKDSCCINDRFTNKTYNGYTSLTAGGWYLSDARTYYNETIYGALPIDLQSVIKEVVKMSDTGYEDRSIIQSTDKCWMPSLEEVGLSPTNIVYGQGTTYPIFTDKTSRIKYTLDISKAMWWTRSTTLSFADGNHYINHLGNNSSNSSYLANNICFGFCI